MGETGTVGTGPAVAPGIRGSLWWQEAVLQRVAVLPQLALAGPGLVAGLLLVNTALGLLGPAFLLATSVVIGDVPAAGAQGLGSPAWDLLTRHFVIASLVFLAQTLLAPVQGALGELMTSRVDERAQGRLISACLSGAGMGPMD